MLCQQVLPAAEYKGRGASCKACRRVKKVMYKELNKKPAARQWVRSLTGGRRRCITQCYSACMLVYL